MKSWEGSITMKTMKNYQCPNSPIFTSWQFNLEPQGKLKIVRHKPKFELTNHFPRENIQMEYFKMFDLSVFELSGMNCNFFHSSKWRQYSSAILVNFCTVPTDTTDEDSFTLWPACRCDSIWCFHSENYRFSDIWFHSTECTCRTLLRSLHRPPPHIPSPGQIP